MGAARLNSSRIQEEFAQPAIALVTLNGGAEPFDSTTPAR
jgi:hypothetical protein